LLADVSPAALTLLLPLAPSLIVTVATDSVLSVTVTGDGGAVGPDAAGAEVAGVPVSRGVCDGGGDPAV